MKRREFISAVGGVLAAQSSRGAKPERMKPEAGDVLVHAFGDSAGSIIQDSEIDNALVFAFPMSSEVTRRVRIGGRALAWHFLGHK